MAINWDKVNQPAQLLQRFASRRSVVHGTKGIVACSQSLAAEAGLEILRQGGNAADAAVAVSAALNVTEPTSCGVGGDAFCLFFDAKSKTVHALNGSGRSPEKLTIRHMRDQGITDRNIPSRNINAATVPGAAAAWVDTVEKLGTMKVADVLAPAIRLAEEGYPVGEITSHQWKNSENLIKNASPNGHEMLLNGRAPNPGEIIKLPNLAKTFREIATHGKDGFYKGRIAEEIVKLVKSGGGVMELEDLAKHKTAFVEPIKYTYAGEVTVYECPPNGSGITTLIALGILEQMQEQGRVKSLLELEHNSAEYLHALIEALRLAFSDALYYVADPDVVHVPVEKLLNREYLAERAKLFDSTKTSPVIYGNPVNSSDTVYFTVADQWGNACSFIQSNYEGFGTAAIPKGCGFTLQNRGSAFILEENHANALEGGKRPYHTIIPALATRGDELFLSFGVMGAFMQPQGHVQVLLNVLRGFTVQAALDAPRFCIDAEPIGEGKNVRSKVFIEDQVPVQVVEQLRAMGHDVELLSEFGRLKMGRGQIIQRKPDPNGRVLWAAGSDPRADGLAIAQI